MGLDALIEVTVKVIAETGGVDSRGMGERRGDGLPCDETPAAERDQLANGHSVAGDDEGLALVESAHDFAAVVAKFSLGDRFSHTTQCSTRATGNLVVYQTPEPLLGTGRPQSQCLGPAQLSRGVSRTKLAIHCDNPSETHGHAAETGTPPRPPQGVPGQGNRSATTAYPTL